MPFKKGDPRNPRRGNGVGKGEGWGGPAKGASTTRIDAGPEGDAIRARAHDPDVKAQREERIARMKAKIFDLAENAQREETQLTAAVAFLNQELGMPVQRQITAAVDDAAKVLRIEIIDEPADAQAGGPAATSSARSND